MLKNIFYLFVISVVVLVSSCEDYKDCNSPVETLMGIGFSQIQNDRETDSIMPALSMYAINKPDSLLAYRAAVRLLNVPLNPHSGETRFFIQADSTAIGGDTLSVGYTTNLHFVSSGCGFTNYYRLDTVSATHHYIDSVALKNNKINTTNATNVKIYY